MLKINKLYASVEDKKILNGVDLHIEEGTVHAIMGPNGSGKSTLANILAGHQKYQVDSGTVDYDGENLLELSPEERARSGLFLAFQYPVELPGVNNMYFLRTSVNAVRKHNGLAEYSAPDFLRKVKLEAQAIGMDLEFLNRGVNEGFSGGEKKRNEMLQMRLLEPRLSILDETDSGLDIDALKTIADSVNALRTSDRSMVVVTHYQRLLDYIVPDYVHVFAEGKVILSGDKSLALDLEKKGYSWIEGYTA